VYQEIVLPDVPAGIQNTCKEIRQPADVQSGAGQGTASCSASGGKVRVTYTKVHNAQALGESLNRVVQQRLGIDLTKSPAKNSPTGACETQVRAWSFWHRPVGASLHHHG
jgi:hypothetical protein